ncbi:fimbrial protein [Pseudomonas saponiphila]|uniref:Pilin (Type 1 fimbria component protein) n=1 Tax=Pseudomonas saponiphila TaxID=556534 RepID=A0A1H4L096_9PSED|nr:fimbrial protein [Pseudomonas saponiphila]SEB64133.1 Pilin (type 1 fimbria component protein) [Pseudomonas saponiphila]
MKKFRLAVGVVSGLLFGANSAFAHDVLVKFEGKVTESTCVVSAEDVKLDHVSVNALKATGDVSSPRPFSINVSGCDGSKLKGRFVVSPSTIDPLTQAIINSAPGGSSAQIQLVDFDGGTVIKLLEQYAGEPLTPMITSDDGANFQFFARYLAANGPATAGDVKAELMFDLIYE